MELKASYTTRFSSLKKNEDFSVDPRKMKFYINVIVECLNITTHLLEMQV
jgi:hypothetical protein